MSTVRKRPDLWSYISFSNTHTRRQSASLPTQNVSPADDPYEKPERRSGRSFSNVDEAYSAETQAQSRRATFLRVGAIVAAVFLLFWYLSREQYIPGMVYTDTSNDNKTLMSGQHPRSQDSKRAPPTARDVRSLTRKTSRCCSMLS